MRGTVRSSIPFCYANEPFVRCYIHRTENATTATFQRHRQRRDGLELPAQELICGTFGMALFWFPILNHRFVRRTEKYVPTSLKRKVVTKPARDAVLTTKFLFTSMSYLEELNCRMVHFCSMSCSNGYKLRFIIFVFFLNCSTNCPYQFGKVSVFGASACFWTPQACSQNKISFDATCFLKDITPPVIVSNDKNSLRGRNKTATTVVGLGLWI